MNLSTQIRKHFPKGLPSFVAVESGLILSSVFLGLSFCHGHYTEEWLESLKHLLSVASIYTFVLIGMMSFLGLYNRRVLVKVYERTPRLLISLSLAFVFMSQLSYLVPSVDLGQTEWLVISIVSFSLLYLLRLTAEHVLDETLYKKRVLVLGAGRKALQLFKRTQNETETCKIQGYVHQPGEREMMEKSHVIYSVSALCDYAKKHDIEEIVVAVDDRRNGFPLEQLLACRLCGIDVTDLVQFYERECGQILLEIMDPSFLIFSAGFKHPSSHVRMKRVLDWLLAGLLILFFSPFYVLFSFLLLLQNGRKLGAFTKTTSVGLGGVPFERFSFATAHSGVISRLVCRLNLEALPELFNVLKGEMSLIGPYPEKLDIAEKTAKEIPYYNERHMVKPGVAGWAKVANQMPKLQSDRLEQLQFDLYYVKNNGLFLDFVILLRLLPQSFVSKNKTLLEKSLISTS